MLEFTVEALPVQPVVYMRRVGAYGAQNYKLMAALKEWANDKGLLKDGIIYGIAHDDVNTPPEKCRYDVCLVSNANCPEDYLVKQGEIPGGRYAVFTIAHTAEAVQAFWASLPHLQQTDSMQFDMSKPVLERYQYNLVEDGKCEFCVPLI